MQFVSAFTWPGRTRSMISSPSSPASRRRQGALWKIVTYLHRTNQTNATYQVNRLKLFLLATIVIELS